MGAGRSIPAFALGGGSSGTVFFSCVLNKSRTGKVRENQTHERMTWNMATPKM